MAKTEADTLFQVPTFPVRKPSYCWLQAQLVNSAIEAVTVAAVPKALGSHFGSGQDFSRAQRR